MNESNVFLVDGTSICYRSFYAVKLSSSKGFPTGAVYGFYATLRKILKRYNPTYVGVCFDVSRKTVRQEKYKEYKIHRPPTPDGLAAQIPLVKRLVKALGFSLLEQEGYEADDLIAALTAQAHAAGQEVVIVTSDKDLFQLLRYEKVLIYDPVKDTEKRRKDFIHEFGFPPENIVDFLALVGDASDNIPGAKGIGKVGAKKLLTRYKTIETLYGNLSELPPKTANILSSQKDSVFLSKELITLMYPDIPWKIGDLAVREAQRDDLRELFQELEFYSFLKDFAPLETKQEIIMRESFDESLPEYIKRSGLCIFFYSYYRDEEIGEENPDGFLYLVGEDPFTVYKVLITDCQSIFADTQVLKVTYNLKQFIHVYGNFSETWDNFFDIKIAAYLVNSSMTDYSFETLCRHYVLGVPVAIESNTAVCYVKEIFIQLSETLKKNNLEDLFYGIEMPLVEVLALIEKSGIAIDRVFLARLAEEVAEKIEAVKNLIYEKSGKTFNLNSPRQLQQILFNELGIKPIKKTKTGFSTNEEVLSKLAEHYPIAGAILEYRSLSKLDSTYIQPFLKQVQEGEGKIFARFNQTGTQTGRLSSSSPNVQNIPIRSVFAQRFRKVFVSSFAGGKILSADYSQIELRILAHFSQEPKLLEAFCNERDIHVNTAALIFSVPSQAVDKRMREIAKRVNFGIVYGMSAFGLARELGVSFEEAQSFINEYFQRYPKVKEFMDTLYQQAQAQGYVTTAMGRRRYFPEINSSDMDKREFAHRQAINAPLQGTAADLIKLAMVRIAKAMKKQKIRSKMILQVHDELVFDIAPNELKEMIPLIKTNMEECYRFSVPIRVNLAVGNNWYELHPVRQ